jgi:predicted kinase
MTTLIIVRGLPGSGKSTLASKLIEPGGVIEADQFFIREDGVYDYQADRIGEAHAWCYARVKQRLQSNTDCVVANTFTQRWEYQRYIDLAKELGHLWQVIDCHGQFRSVHAVPDAVIDQMRARWQPHGV